MNLGWYAAIAGVFVIGAFIHGALQTWKERKDTWQRLSDAFGGVTVRRIMNVAPSGSADRLDYDGQQFLGAFELTNDVLRFYRLKVKNGSIVEFPLDRIQESKRIVGQHEPAATLLVESQAGRRFKIEASVPEELCARLVRLEK